MTTPKKNKGTNKGWENLIPAKKGECRNPKGRPKKEKCIPDILRIIGAEQGSATGDMSKIEAVLRRVYKFAVEGEAWAVNFIADRTEGKAITTNVNINPDIPLYAPDLIEDR